MRILNSPWGNNWYYIVTCSHCSTQIEFERDEGKLVHDQKLIGTNCKTGTALKFTCPVCYRDIWYYDPDENPGKKHDKKGGTL